MRHVGASPLEHVTITSHKLCAQKHALWPLLPGRKRVICNVPGSVCVCVCVCVCVKYINQRLHHKHTPKMGSYLKLDRVIANFNAVVPESVEPVLLHTCIHMHIQVHIDTHVHIHIHINVHSAYVYVCRPVSSCICFRVGNSSSSSAIASGASTFAASSGLWREALRAPRP